MKRRISVFGLGYVGSVTAACLVHKGHQVLGVDTNPAKVDSLESGRSPIVETGLDELVLAGRQSCRLHATMDSVSAILRSEASLVCVGTPNHRNGKLDLTNIEHVCRQIGEALRSKDEMHHIVLRSTVLPGTTETVVVPALEAYSGKRAGIHFSVSYNPEFLREGTAVADFFQPPLLVFGVTAPSDLTLFCDLYEGSPAATFQTSVRTAEMVKYACNAFHAIKVGFANELGTLCKAFGAETQAVAKILTSDTQLNISPAYLSPGFAFGGSCLPKDLRALIHHAKEFDLELPLLEGVLPSNRHHLERAAELILATGIRKLGILGLSFKAGTDDLRESPIVLLIKLLIGEGIQIRVWDPDVLIGRLLGSNRQYIDDIIPHIGTLLCSTIEEALQSAQAVLIGTNIVAPETLNSLLRPEQKVIDLVNLDPMQRVAGTSSYEGICW